MHLLSAFVTNTQAVIGQLKMEKGENEITAALRLLEERLMAGSLQATLSLPKKVCSLIKRKGGDYLFSLKNNNKAKVKEAALQFTTKPFATLTEADKGHSRVEERTLKVMDIPKHLCCWAGVEQIIEITRKRWIKVKNKETTEVSFAITSLSANQASPQQLMKLLRDHWKIENNLHRTRDMAFDEDRSTIRKGSPPEVMAALRNTAIQIAQKITNPWLLFTT